jgi:hypothetical protein
MKQGDLFDPKALLGPLNRALEGLQAGLLRRDQGIAQVSQGNEPWLLRARATARLVAQERGQVCSDDIHERCPPPPGTHPNVMGAVFRSTGLEQVGWRLTTRPEGRGRAIRVYRLPEA